MSFTIPDKGTGVHNHQSVLFKEYVEVLVEAMQGNNCVLSGLAMTGGADMTPDVAKGAVLTNGILKAVAAASVTVTTADATNPRIDLVVVNSSGALAVRAGTAAANPKPPARTANDVVIAAVYVAANDTAIGTTDITDMRVIVGQNGPLCIYRTTTQEVTNNSASALHMLNKSGSGVVIPSGLLAAGRILRVRIVGNVLINSGTPTSTVIISFGGTTWFSDVTAAGAADADRRAFVIEFLVVAQASNVQHTVGIIAIQVQAATVTAPTSGIAGEIGGTTGATASIVSPFEGAAGSVDADAADRTLAATWTFSSGNAANELVVEGATVELI